VFVFKNGLNLKIKRKKEKKEKLEKRKQKMKENRKEIINPRTIKNDEKADRNLIKSS
jgi:hypothetical protein